MPGAMRLMVLISMFIVEVFSVTPTSPRAIPLSSSTVPAKYTIVTISKRNTTILSTLSATKVATTSEGNGPTSAFTSIVTSPKPSSLPTSANSFQTSSTSKHPEQASSATKETNASPTMQTPKGTTAGIPTKQTMNRSTAHDATLPTPSEKPNVTTTANGNGSNTTDYTAHQLGGKDLTKNPGLVAVLCIFFIVLGLALVVAIVKACQSRKSNFERLEDVPMGKVNEESPFANYSK